MLDHHNLHWEFCRESFQYNLFLHDFMSNTLKQFWGSCEPMPMHGTAIVYYKRKYGIREYNRLCVYFRIIATEEPIMIDSWLWF